ncbi:potassium transporter Kef [Desulfoluna limicola]|uniref:Potassium transporter Kef n=1 Tax=Desulfoluna limicola TaxID=2810562 RepID=A0ABM7PGZ0_9BACT|nr:cation:proton antiporter family protein [Desulfoluna limicola]BCS96343.1 potassium transporter Kef [Desulfoluna limicola]
MDPEILTVAFGFGYLVYRLGLPPMVGFLLAGLCLNAFGFTSTPLLQAASDVGVTLLLFTIGLKLRIKNLLKPEVWAGASLHMGITVAVIGFALFCFGYTGLRFFMEIDPKTALLLGFALSFSSTVFAVKILDESGRMDSLNGRTAIGVLVIQDIVAVIYLTLATGKLPSPMALLVIALLPVAMKVFQMMLTRVGHGELMVLFGLFLALIAGAHSFDLVQLKPDLGALILGMLMAPHPRAKEMANSLMNVKDILLVGFFLDIGLRGIPDASGFAAAGVLVALLPLKMGAYFLIFTRFRLKARTSFITMANLSNYSEFGLIVCSLAASTGSLDPQWLVVIAIALSVSFIIASPLNKHADRIFEVMSTTLKRFESKDRHAEEVPYERKPVDIVIIGMGRTGVGAYDWFHEQYGDVVLGIDFDQETIARHAEQGRVVDQADVTDPDFWRRLPAPDGTVKLVVLALNNFESMLTVIQKFKKYGYRGELAAIARFDDEVEMLREAGVDIAMNVFAEAGAGLAAHAASSLGTLGSK